MKRSLFLIFIIVFFFGCAGMELEDTAGPPAIPPPPLGTSSELTAGTVTSARSWAPKTLSDQFSGASAEVVNEAVSTANFDGDTSHAASQDALENYFLLGDADLDGLPDILDTDAVDAITEIASGIKSGSDGTVITGTAGTDTYTAVWNADGDLVDGYDPATKADVAGDTFTGEITLDENGVEFQETDTISDCSGFAATGGGLFYDDSEGKFKKCQDNVLTDLDTGGGISDLDDLPGDTIDDDLIDSALVANFPDQSVDSGANPVLDGENFSNLQMDALVPTASTTQEILDSGDGNPATGSTTPNTSGYPETNDMTCSDSDTCAITMGETSIKDNQEYTIRNVGTNAITFADTAGVQELASSPITLVQGESISFIYSTTLSAWTEKNKTNAVSFSSLTLPTTTSGDQALTVGMIGIKTDEDLIVYHGGANGEVQDEVGKSLLTHISFPFDPVAWYDQESTYRSVPIMIVGDDFPHGFTITEWSAVYVGGDPTTELNADIICDTSPDYNTAAAATVMDVIDTTAGTSSADTGFDSATCANGSYLYIHFGADPTDANVVVAFDLWGYAEED